MIMKSGAEGADNFLTIENGQFPPPPPKYMPNDDFSEPPRRADSKNPIFNSFCRISGPGHRRGLGVSLGRIVGGVN